MTQINTNSINQYENQYKQVKNPAFKNVANNNVYIPSYYLSTENNTKSFKESIESNPLLSLPYEMLVKPFVEHPLAIIPTWLGISLGLDAYSHACGGKYEKSLVYKAANAGDKLQNSKFIQNKPVQSVLNGFGKIKKGGEKLVQNSAILRAMKDTPSLPEWSMVKTQMFNQEQEVVQEFLRITDALKLNSADAPRLKDIGLADFEKKMLKETFNVTKISQIPEEKAVVQVLLNRLGKTKDQIKGIQSLGANSISATKNEILKEMELNKKTLELIKEDTLGNYIDTVKTATSKVKGRVKMGAGHYGWMGPISKLFERTIGCDEIYNKLHSMSGGAKTGTGKFFSKAMQTVHRGITFNSGKLGALVFIAPILVELANNVKKADKDQKVGTLFGGFIESTSWVLTFPLALKMMHSLGGVQYAGMSKDKVAQYRQALNDFNKRVEPEIIENGQRIANPNAFSSKSEYNVARKTLERKLNSLKEVKGQNIFTKGLRKLASFMTLDLETIKSYRNGNPIENLCRKMGYYCKNTVGIPMRFVIWGLLSMGVLGAAITKASNAVFGKSYDAMKHEENEDNKKREKEFLKEDLNKRIYTMAVKKQQEKQKTQASEQIYPKTNNIATKGKDVSAIKQPQIVVPTKENVDNYTYIPSAENIIPHDKNSAKTLDNYTYIPSSECTIKSDKVNEKNRKYIPSQAAANISKNFDNSGLQSALDRAQRAETKALRILSGNFEQI